MTLLEQIQILKAAIRSGARVVQYGDRRQEYRDLSEMRSILKEMELEAGVATSGRKRTTPSFFKGY